MASTYEVVWGDTLTALAKKFNTTVSNLVKWNDITDPNYIVVGQNLVTSAEDAVSTSSSTTARATIKAFGLQTGTDNTLYATWTWTKDNTDNYELMWYYATGDGIWFVGNDGTTKYKQATYSIPSNATKVKFKVKPVSKKHKVNDKETSYWTASWSTEVTYNVSDSPPKAPGAPTVVIDKFKLTASLANIDLNADKIQFQIVKNDTSVFKTGTAKITTNAASYSCTVDAGNEYKVRCRSYRDDMYSDWSEYSANTATIPAASSGITTCRAASETSVTLKWAAVKTATSYDIEHTTDKTYFDTTSQTTTVNNITTNTYTITGLESGDEYFFRVRAVNEKGTSAWSDIKSVVIGRTPVAPTTWSSTTTAVTGDALNLYWVHNAEDGSHQTYAEVEMYIDGVKTTETVKFTVNEDEEEQTSVYAIDTSKFVEGTKIQWRVRTAGITLTYGEWSTQRTIDIYAPPTLQLNVTDINGNNLETLQSFPFRISALAGPNTQAPLGYHVNIISNDSYDTVDAAGNLKMVSAGDVIYSKYYDITTHLALEISAGSVDLENNINYTIVCTVAMNSGLTAESSVSFAVAWVDEQYEPNAEIGIDTEMCTAFIRPYCVDENGVLIKDVLLSVYRREFDGAFVEIMSGLENTDNIFITDPHPALDYARYRIVATTKSTGAVSFYDVPGQPVNVNAAIIQWDEKWTDFNVMNDEGDYIEDPLAQINWSGSMLKLPYNLDTSDDNSNDVTLVKYQGRKHPVSYYGTQTDSTATWNMVIPKEDTETLHGLRILMQWKGDVYVREPSGSGYWASVKVSFSQKHNNVTIPITINITRVEGGI